MSEKSRERGGNPSKKKRMGERKGQRSPEREREREEGGGNQVHRKRERQWGDNKREFAFVFLTNLMMEDCWNPKDLDVSSFPKVFPLKEDI